MPGAADGMDVCVLDAALDHVVLAAHQAAPRGLFGGLREPRRRAAVDGPEHLHVPALGVAGGRLAQRPRFVQRDQEVFGAALLPPPLLEVVQNVPCRRALDAAVDVVPRLPGPTLLDGRATEVGLVEVHVVRGAQRAEQRVHLRVVPPVAEVDAAEEAHEPRRRVRPRAAAAVDTTVFWWCVNMVAVSTSCT
jgi:hypothetical protein